MEIKNIRFGFLLFHKIILLLVLSLQFFIFFADLSVADDAVSRYREARKLYHSLINKKPAKRDLWIECAKDFKKIYSKFPQSEQSVKSLFSEANLYFELGKLSKNKSDLLKAENLYIELTKKHPESRFADDAVFKIGEINIRRGDKKAAIRSFNTLIDRYPEGDMWKRAAKRVKELSLSTTSKKKSVLAAGSKAAASGSKLKQEKKCIIVIDPGHGGKDAGATGVHGIKEKEVVLDISNRLKRVILKRGVCKVIMTRERDTYITLPKRTDIANSSNANLFISIHANASKNKNVYGIETYFQGLPRTQQERETAARENMVVIKREFSTKDDMLGFILSDMNNTYLINESSNLAGVIQNYLIKGLGARFAGIKNLGVKQALFYVLHDAQMPSILVEVSFITNPNEGKRLAGKEYRWAISLALYKGINAYIKSMAGGN